MKKILLLLGAFACVSLLLPARNTIVSVGQVTEPVVLSDDVDYVITGTEPFAVTGSIDITNTEHAVVIFENLRPSRSLPYLTFITINGEPAVNDENCQVKMYAQGAIVLPYAKDIRPLTVYSEPNFGGKAVNTFGLENSGGYMNTLGLATLNNAIRSFKLKRGYMVTFSTQAAGRGYQRCFIADQEDLEFATLPGVLDRRISSYRIFKWYDAEKKGLANNTSYEATQALNVSWCYSFSLGENRGMDCECVPHHIKEGWPSISSCGSVTYSPHLKNNNEPANSGDEAPATVEECLASWPDLMRTGMRLCSPSSHDGGYTWLHNFMDSIDARGWRCDVLDMHAYWTAGTFNTAINWYNRHLRPIWLSEMLWGSSWGGNNPDTGIFAATSGDERNFNSVSGQEKNYNGMKPILDKLNQWGHIERYAYWNSWGGVSQIYVNGTLSKLGKYYAEMKSGMAYNKAYEYVPKFVFKAPGSLTATYKTTATAKTVTLTWTNANGEMTDTAYVEMKAADGTWTVQDCIVRSEETAQSVVFDMGSTPEGGMRTYRIRNLDCDGVTRLTDEASVSIGGVSQAGDIQCGRLDLGNTEAVITYFQRLADGSIPAAFSGPVSLNNTTMGLVGGVKAVANAQFNYTLMPWTISYTTEMTSPENVDVFVVGKGRYTYGDMEMEVGSLTSNVGRDTVTVTFAQPFPEGVVPVVMTAANPLIALAYPTVMKVFDVTNTGFKTKMTRQAGLDETYPTFATQKAVYLAITPGTAKLAEGKRISAGRATTRVGGSTTRTITFADPDGNTLYLDAPYVLMAPQTHYIDASSVLRLQRYVTKTVTTDGESETKTIGAALLRQVDKSAGIKTDLAAYNGDYIGWVAVSDDKTLIDAVTEVNAEIPFAVSVSGRTIRVDGAPQARIYSMSGVPVRAGVPVAPGLYVVVCGRQSVKVSVK